MQWGKCGCDDSYWGPVSNNFPPSHTNSPSSCPQRFQGSQNGALQHPLLSLWLSLPIQARRSQNKQITIRHGSRMLVVWPHILHLIHYFPWCPIPVMPLLCPPSYLQFSGSPNVFWGCLHAKSLQLYLTLCDPMDCSLPGSSVHGIHQARILEWIVMTSSRGSSQPRDWTYISYVSCIAGRFFTTSVTLSASKPTQVFVSRFSKSLGRKPQNVLFKQTLWRDSFAHSSLGMTEFNLDIEGTWFCYCSSDLSYF